jgi:metal-responsive CopG/Arc/MetJ family transcriptional regulator
MCVLYVCIIITEVKPMRVTVHLQDSLAVRLKETARDDRLSVSSLVSSAVEHYLHERRRRALGNRILALAGKVRVAPDALASLDEGRADDRS